jgi:hypothetical protein
MIEASNTIYLPEGNFIIEMVFMNSGALAVHNGSGIPATYANGPNVDILTFERVGDGTPPVWDWLPENAFILPILPNDAAGNVLRQRGWGTNGVSGEWGTITGSPLTPTQIAATTHIVFEVAARPTGNVDVVLAGNAPGLGDWNQQTYSSTGQSTTGHNAEFDPATRTYTIDLQLHEVFETWRNSTIGRFIVSHNSDGWDELNVITAYILVDDLDAVSIAEVEREIPVVGGDEEASVIAPVAVSSGEFTVGPNPVSRSSGEMNFYWNGRRISSSVLTIFDASGNVVSRIEVADCANCTGGSSRVIGSWDLTDNQGRLVSEGTYLVRGTVTTLDGRRERVSTLIGVR